MKKLLLASAAALALGLAVTSSVQAGEAEAQKWVANEFQPSSLTQEEQLAEMNWFIEAAKPLAGMDCNWPSI